MEQQPAVWRAHRGPPAAMKTPTPKALSLLSLNVNGLHSRAKRGALFHELKVRRYDVVLLQETHHGSEAEGRGLANERVDGVLPWDGPSFWSHGTNQSRGVAILVRRGSPAESPTLLHNSTSGRICAITFTFLDRLYSLFNVYAPSGADSAAKQAFFCDSLLPALPAHQSRILLGGDFNCVECGLDCTSGAAGGRLAGFEGGLQEVLSHCDLLDVWRTQHGRRQAFTHTAAGGRGLSGARLDRWYVSQDLPQWVAAPRKPVLGLPGDHLGVCLALRAPSPSLRGPGSWALPHSLLCREDYKLAMHQLLADCLSQPLSAHSGSRAQRYEHAKVQVQLRSRLLAAELAQEARVARAALTRRADRAFDRHVQAPACPHALAAFREAQAELQVVNAERAAKAALHAGLVNQHFGERSSAWFYQQAKIREAQTSFPAIRAAASQQPVPLTTEAACVQAGEVVADYFDGAQPQGLYRQRQVEVPAQAELLGALDCFLTQEARAGAEGPPGGHVTLEELTSALDSAARGAAPGLDGLPYEFYRELWDVLGPELVAVANEAFDQPGAALPASFTKGRVTLLHKPGKDRTLPESYRPITLLNADYKLLAKVTTARLGPALHTVVDPTQTAFLPDRSITDNVMAHLEEIEYLQEVQQPGVLAFLDFEKAFDRVDRGWIMQCLARLGFGPSLLRWVSLLHTNTTAQADVNGFPTGTFSLLSGVFQGSPLLPLLYVATTQPISAHARAQARSGAVEPIRLPDGSAAPLLHLHADDTSLHTRTLEGMQHLLQGTVALHCRATAAHLQHAKSQGLHLGVPSPITGPHPGSGICFVGQGERVKHLGVLHSGAKGGEATAMYEGLLQRMRKRVSSWCQRNLSLVGRVHVAKQVLVSMLTYLAGHVPPPPALQQQICTLIYTYVANNRLADPEGPTSCMHPSRAVAQLPVIQGGLGMSDVAAHFASMHAKLVARWLEPERLPWKAFFDQWLYRDPAWLRANPRVAPRRQDVWGLGRFLPFSQFPLASLEAPPRVKALLKAYAGLRPHRLCPPAGLSLLECQPERLFYNAQVCDAAGVSLRGALWKPWAQQGIVSVGALRARLLRGSALPPGLDTLLECLPARFREALQGQLSGEWLLRPADPVAEQPAEVLHSAGGACERFLVASSGQLLSQGSCDPLSGGSESTWQEALVMDWDPARPHRGCLTYEPPEGGAPFLLGPASDVSLLPAVWGRSSFPVHALVVKEATRRQLWLASRANVRLQLAPGQALVPQIWGNDPSQPAAGLQALESKWNASRDAGPAPPTQVLPSYYLPATRPRPAPRDRSGAPAGQGARARGRQPRGGPPADELDAAECRAPPNPLHTRVWRDLSQPDLHRPARITAWRVLHGSLAVGAFLAHVYGWGHNDTRRFCPHRCCTACAATLSHTFLHCSAVAPVVAYTQRLWAAIDPAAAPLQPAVLLTADPRCWAPSPAFHLLWVRLRVYFLQAVWAGVQRARSSSDSSGPSHGSSDSSGNSSGGSSSSSSSGSENPRPCTAIIAGMLHACRTNMMQDWALAVSGFREPGADAPTNQLRGLSPKLSKELFFRKWGGRGVLCREQSEGKLQVLWGLGAPVPAL